MMKLYFLHLILHITQCWISCIFFNMHLLQVKVNLIDATSAWWTIKFKIKWILVWIKHYNVLWLTIIIKVGTQNLTGICVVFICQSSCYSHSQNTLAMRNTSACYWAYWRVVNTHESCMRWAAYFVRYTMAQ